MYPLVSIVIPVYNGEDYLKEAIDSALGQSYPKVEIIVVNDGSVDGTEQVAKSYGKKIRYIYKENGGVSSALNVGIKNMTGEYFCWLSHDDVFYPYKIEVQMRALLNSGEPMTPVYGNWDILMMPRRTLISNRSVRDTYGQACEQGIFPVMFYLIHGCTILLHKDFFLQNGLFDENLMTAQDYDMWFRLFQGRNSIYIDQPLIASRCHEKQGSRTMPQFKKNCQVMHDKMMQYLTEEEIGRNFQGKYKFLFDMLMLSFRNGWEDCAQKIYENFVKCEVPLDENKHHSVYLYGAGYVGKDVLESCRLKGIKVLGFIDANTNLWGTFISNVKCLSYEDVPSDAEIWICIENKRDWAIRNDLLSKGFSNVWEYRAVLGYLFFSMPVKDKVDLYIKEKGYDNAMLNGR